MFGGWPRLSFSWIWYQNLSVVYEFLRVAALFSKGIACLVCVCVVCVWCVLCGVVCVCVVCLCVCVCYQSVCQRAFSLLAIWCLGSRVQILLSAEEHNLSPFDLNIACLCQSIEINNSKYVYVYVYVYEYVYAYVHIYILCTSDLLINIEATM